MFFHTTSWTTSKETYEIVYNAQGILFYIQFCSTIRYDNPYISMHTWDVQMEWYWHTHEESIDLNAMDHYIAIEMMGLECE